jgi:AhpD family alkylhydroperoxidase
VPLGTLSIDREQQSGVTKDEIPHRETQTPLSNGQAAPRRCLVVPACLSTVSRCHQHQLLVGGTWKSCWKCNLQPMAVVVTHMGEHNHFQDVLNELNPQGRALREMIPDVYRGFSEMSGAALTSGALDRKLKELIGLAIAVAVRCDGCIADHARGAVRAGASKEEAAEAIGVSIVLQGGPATVYGARAYAAFCEFADAAATAG